LSFAWKGARPRTRHSAYAFERLRVSCNRSNIACHRKADPAQYRGALRLAAALFSSDRFGLHCADLAAPIFKRLRVIAGPLPAVSPVQEVRDGGNL